MNCRNGHDLGQHGRVVDVGYGTVFRCMACRRAAKDRENAMNRALRAAARRDVCRRGHPRSMSRRRTSGELRCLECDRLAARRRRDKLKGVK